MATLATAITAGEAAAAAVDETGKDVAAVVATAAEMRTGEAVEAKAEEVFKAF